MQVDGIKGPTWLSCLKSLDIVKGMSPDYMHYALLGVSKLLLSLWIDGTRCCGTTHDLHSKLTMIDTGIHHIEVPSEVRRKTRNINKLKY